MIRWQNNVFVRHADDESIVWCPRTGGCTVLKDARPFLEEISHVWRSEDEIVAAVARKFGVETTEVSGDTCAIFSELDSQGFAVREDGELKSRSCELDYVTSKQDAFFGEDDDYLPVGDFYVRHGLPVELHIDLTDACTERCVHCYVPQGQGNFLPFEMVEKALREFRSMNGLSVHLTGGECMLHPQFLRICRLCKELELNMIVFSNLTLCDEKMVKELREIDPQFINVSLYSMQSEIHDAITQVPGSWKKTMDAFLWCEKSGVHCRIATPLLKENRDSFPALKAFASEHRTHLVPSYDIIAKSDHDCANLCHACSAAEVRAVLQRNADVFDKDWTREMPSCGQKVCDIGVARLYLNAKGLYYPCDSMHGYVLGNVREHTVENIWRGEKLEYLRSLKNEDFGKCARCEHRPWCKVCPAYNFNATGDMFKTIPEKCALGAVIHEIYGGK